jgi:hypothetical protein
LSFQSRALAFRPPSTLRRISAALALATTIFAVPLVWRVLVQAWGPRDATRSYLPAVEAARPRLPFRSLPIEELRYLKPGYIILGDSMAGRIHRDRLAHLTNDAVAPMQQVATGSARWYLIFKNYIVFSGVRPKYVVVYFRDTNLTDPTWRLLGDQREGTDEVALQDEPELNAAVAARLAGPWYRAHQIVDDVYAVSRTRSWLQPKLTFWPARVLAGTRGGHDLERDVNAMFGLERLRPIPQSDMAAAEDREADFDRWIDASILPAWLALAREHDLRLLFVRVQRRTLDGKPRPESAALVEYVDALREYVTARGALFIDERDYPAISALPYHDGDHLAPEARPEYTAIFHEMLKSLPR